MNLAKVNPWKSMSTSCFLSKRMAIRFCLEDIGRVDRATILLNGRESLEKRGWEETARCQVHLKGFWDVPWGSQMSLDELHSVHEPVLVNQAASLEGSQIREAQGISRFCLSLLAYELLQDLGHQLRGVETPLSCCHGCRCMAGCVRGSEGCEGGLIRLAGSLCRFLYRRCVSLGKTEKASDVKCRARSYVISASSFEAWTWTLWDACPG
jgi:hypothetical protein